MRKIAGRIMVDMDDFSASIEFDDWIAELSPLERADLTQDVLQDALFEAELAYDDAVKLLHASFVSKGEPKQ